MEKFRNLKSKNFSSKDILFIPNINRYLIPIFAADLVQKSQTESTIFSTYDQISILHQQTDSVLPQSHSVRKKN